MKTTTNTTPKTTAYLLDHTAAANLDQVNVMDYDLATNSNGTTADAEGYTAAWASHVTGGTDAAGAAVRGSKGQLVMGMPFYGDAAGGAQTYADIVTAAQQQGVSLDTDTPTLDFGTGPETVSFNIPRTIADKTTFALTGGYGGVMASGPSRQRSRAGTARLR